MNFERDYAIDASGHCWREKKKLGKVQEADECDSRIWDEEIWWDGLVKSVLAINHQFPLP